VNILYWHDQSFKRNLWQTKKVLQNSFHLCQQSLLVMQILNATLRSQKEDLKLPPVCLLLYLSSSRSVYVKQPIGFSYWRLTYMCIITDIPVNRMAWQPECSIGKYDGEIKGGQSMGLLSIGSVIFWRILTSPGQYLNYSDLKTEHWSF
jgi:hypothetical protein